MKKKKKRLFLICICFLVIVFVLEVLILIKINKGNNEINENIINVIETPMLDIKYGFEEVDKLKVTANEKAPYDLTFYADVNDKLNMEILTLFFDDEDNRVPIGTVLDKSNKKVEISYQMIDLNNYTDLDEEEIVKLHNVQVALLNKIISNLNIIEYPANSEIIKADSIIIETPYLDIPYPKEWEEYLVVEQTEDDLYMIEFACQFKDEEPVELFKYTFGEDAENIIGYYNDISVGFSVAEGEVSEKWEQDEIDIFYSMREDSSYILNYLIESDGFILK